MVEITAASVADLLAVGSAPRGFPPIVPDPLNPLAFLGDAAVAAVGNAWTVAMVGLWSAGLWLLQLSFTVVDALTTPDLTEAGPMRGILATTLWLGASVAGLMMLLQLVVALVRRDGASLGRVLLGILQFGFVWVSFLGVAALAVTAAAGLAKGILRATLGVDALAAMGAAKTRATLVGSGITVTLRLSSAN